MLGDGNYWKFGCYCGKTLYGEDERRRHVCSLRMPAPEEPIPGYIQKPITYEGGMARIEIETPGGVRHFSIPDPVLLFVKRYGICFTVALLAGNWERYAALDTDANTD